MPLLLALRGAPGTGKSTLGRAVSQTLHWPLIDKDDIRDALPARLPEAGGLAYDVMFSVARRQLLAGMNVICDSPFSYRASYFTAQRIVAETGARLAALECSCSDERIWRQRIEARSALKLPAHRTTSWADVEAFYERVAADPGFAIPGPRFQVDTAQPPEETLAQSLAWLQTLFAASA